MADKIKGFVPMTFNDEGTGKTFAGGKSHDFDAGTHANYLAAGLITDAPAKADAAAPVESTKEQAIRPDRAE